MSVNQELAIVVRAICERKLDVILGTLRKKGWSEPDLLLFERGARWQIEKVYQQTINGRQP